MSAGMLWRDDLDALQFAAGNGGNCLIHRRAFRVILRKPPLREDCIAFYHAHRAAFEAAASAKIGRGETDRECNFHLNSRQIRNSLDDVGTGNDLA